MIGAYFFFSLKNLIDLSWLRSSNALQLRLGYFFWTFFYSSSSILSYSSTHQRCLSYKLFYFRIYLTRKRIYANSVPLFCLHTINELKNRIKLNVKYTFDCKFLLLNIFFYSERITQTKKTKWKYSNKWFSFCFAMSMHTIALDFIYMQFTSNLPFSYTHCDANKREKVVNRLEEITMPITRKYINKIR